MRRWSVLLAGLIPVLVASFAVARSPITAGQDDAPTPTPCQAATLVSEEDPQTGQQLCCLLAGEPTPPAGEAGEGLG